MVMSAGLQCGSDLSVLKVIPFLWLQRLGLKEQTPVNLILVLALSAAWACEGVGFLHQYHASCMNSLATHQQSKSDGAMWPCRSEQGRAERSQRRTSCRTGPLCWSSPGRATSNACLQTSLPPRSEGPSALIFSTLCMVEAARIASLCQGRHTRVMLLAAVLVSTSSERLDIGMVREQHDPGPPTTAICLQQQQQQVRIVDLSMSIYSYFATCSTGSLA